MSINILFAKKVNMTQMFSPKGKRLGVTILTVPEAKIIAHRTMDKNGYTAVQLELDTKYSKTKTTKKEIRTESADSEYKWEEVLKVGDKVNVAGISKGHGFTGVVKRYHFAGGPRTHGQSNRERSRGSSGSTTTPGRVYPGKRMSGRMGNERITVRNLEVVSIDPEKRLLILDGSVPGPKTGLVEITKV